MLGGKHKADPDIDLALVLGGEPKDKKPKPMMGEGEGDTEEAGEGEELPPGFAQAAEEAFDTERSVEERTAALHRAIGACTGGGY
jgi:hypothetical protein